MSGLKKPGDNMRLRLVLIQEVVRYPGFKEELYLSGFEPSPVVLDDLAIDRQRVVVVLRPPPDGALYHRIENTRFDEVVAH